ncbi:MAG: hypothetical protein JMJ93_08060 [Synergistaceae bacterium]|nr:hypothetical protein [Synergistaceae bacterium]
MTFLSLAVFLPFLAGLAVLALGRGGRLAEGGTGVAVTVGALHRLAFSFPPSDLVLSGPFGVHLFIDDQSALFVLLAGLVVTAVAPEERERPPFQGLVLLLLGACNAAFVSYDFFNVYVAIELVTLLGFLLIRWGGGLRRTWAAVKYLMTGHVGMILYLLGCLEAFGATGSFSMAGLADLPPLALLLMASGLAVKGGLFVLGLWLPEAHGGAAAPVSALLSAVVVTTGLAPLLRFASVEPRLLGPLTALALLSFVAGSLLALKEDDYKRLLASSTLAQVGLILVVPALGAQYALYHGLCKGWLFLTAGRMPHRSVTFMARKGLPWPLLLSLLGASLALSGAPFLGAPGLKESLGEAMSPPWGGLFKILALLTPIYLLRPLLGRPRLIRQGGWQKWLFPLLLSLSLVMMGHFLGWTPSHSVIPAVVTLLLGLTVAFLLPLPGEGKGGPWALENLENLLGLSVLFAQVLLLVWRWLP